MTDIAGIIGTSTVGELALSATQVESNSLAQLAQRDVEATQQLEALLHALQSTANSFRVHKPKTD